MQSIPSERFPLGASLRLADLDVDPYPPLAELRGDEPVSWVPEIRMWFVTRRDDIVAVLRDAVRFTTEAERSVIRDIFGAHMMTTDGEVALRYKRACLHAFRADTLSREMAPWIEDRADGLVEAAVGAGGAGLMAEVATPLAVDTALRMLGLPLDMAATIVGWYDDFAAALANFIGDEAVRMQGRAAAEAFGAAVRPLLADTPPEQTGLLAHLAGQREDRWADEEIISNALIILFGGIETTASMIGNTVWSLLATDTWPAFVRSPKTRAGVIEEALRWQPAVQSITRHAVEGVVLRGVEIEAGQVVQCMIGGANRDPAHFTDPDLYQPGRSNSADHLSFGTGRHLCLGAHLARIEIGAVLDALRVRAPGLRFAGGETPVLRGYEFRRPVELRVEA